MESEIEQRVMFLMKEKTKKKKRNIGRNRTALVGKHHNIWEKRKLYVLGIIKGRY